MVQTGAVGTKTILFVLQNAVCLSPVREFSIENFAKDFEDNTLECNAMVIRICGVGFQGGVD